jgi:hypothetical protein
MTNEPDIRNLYKVYIIVEGWLYDPDLDQLVLHDEEEHWVVDEFDAEDKGLDRALIAAGKYDALLSKLKQVPEEHWERILNALDKDFFFDVDLAPAVTILLGALREYALGEQL